MKTQYVTDDGAVFDGQAAAEEHEAQMNVLGLLGSFPNTDAGCERRAAWVRANAEQMHMLFRTYCRAIEAAVEDDDE